MGQIQDNFVAYVSHLQVAVEEAPAQPDTKRMRYSAAEDARAGRGRDARHRGEHGRRGPRRRVSTRRSTRAVDGEITASGGGVDPDGRADCRCGSTRPPGATSRASAGAARSTSSATAADPTPAAVPAMRDFSADLTELRRRVDGAVTYLGIDDARARDRGARGRGCAARPLGRPGGRPQGDDRAVALSATTSRWSSSSTARVADLETLAELAREEGDESQEPEIAAGIAALDRRARHSRAARAVHRRARRPRRDLHGQLRRGRHRRAGLDQHAVAHVPALGGAARLRRRDRRGVAGHRGRASARRRSRSRAATRTGCSPASAACTGSSASRRSTPTRAARPRSRRSTWCPRSTRPRRRRSTRATCASTRTGRRARVASTSTSPTPRCGSRTSHRHRGVVPERAVADPEQGAGDADPRRTPRGAAAPGAQRRARGAVGGEARRRVRQPDPHLHAAPVPTGEGRAHPARDRQRAGGARRRARRVHRVVPPVAPTPADQTL